MAAGLHVGKLQRHRTVSLRQHGFLVIIIRNSIILAASAIATQSTIRHNKQGC